MGTIKTFCVYHQVIVDYSSKLHRSRQWTTMFLLGKQGSDGVPSCARQRPALSKAPRMESACHNCQEEASSLGVHIIPILKVAIKSQCYCV